ncbi:MAG: HipA domain-containing protein [Bacteroidota bacterium]|nr:HipA domain-containing protein [Bacteroidota bacterium]
MKTYFDISGWEEKKHLQTKGTRDKSVVQNPENGEMYYFKTSIKKDKKDYKYEFWSEIIASKIGRALGFNVLQYEIANKSGKIGCLSKAMNKENETLTEGISFLTAYDNSYRPDSKSSYSLYTLDLICNALKCFNIERHIDDIYRTLIFDFIIGNSDRHQENWGFISESESQSFLEKVHQHLKKIPIVKKVIRLILPRTYHFVSGWFIKKKEKYRFAPIYDNGCCLCREINDDKISLMLHNPQKINAYVDNQSKSEIRTPDGNKYKHIELMYEIKKRNKDFFNSEINRIVASYDEQKLREIVYTIDNALPNQFAADKLPKERKELMLKIISLRIDRLRNLLK